MNSIELINNMILQAQINGADLGGSYDQNEDELRKAMQAFLDYMTLNHTLSIEQVDITLPEQHPHNGTWSCLQFIKKM